MNTELTSLYQLDAEITQDERLSNWAKHQVYMTNDEIETNKESIKFHVQFFGVSLLLIAVLLVLSV